MRKKAATDLYVRRGFYFDVGGVLIEDKFGKDARGALREIALRHGADAEVAYAAYRELQPHLDRGSATLADFCGAARLDQQAFEREWITLHPVDSKVMNMLEQLLRNGERVGLATNFCRQLLDLLVANNPVLRCVLICCSSDWGLVKPSHKFFRLASEMIRSREIIFVDDRMANIRAAQQFGWTAIPVTAGWLGRFEQTYCRAIS